MERGHLVDNVLGVYEAPLFVAELAAFEVAELFQLIEAAGDVALAVRRYCGKTREGVVPIVTQGEHGAEQPASLE